MLLDLLPAESTQHLKERKQGGSIRWLCKDCHTPIADHRHLISVDGASPYRVFQNPVGILFTILTLTQCQSVSDCSPEIWENTWFPGYPWVVLNCSVCNQHLGWRYPNPEKTPSEFFGLVRDHLVEAKG